MRKLRGLVPTILIGVMGNSVIYMIPLLVGGMVNDRGFSEAQSGYMASADLAGYAISTVLTAMVINRWSWHRLAYTGLVLMVLANFGTTFASEIPAFTLARVVNGLGSGILAALASVSVGQSDNPDRNYGLLLAASLLYGTAALWGLPVLLAYQGLNGAYWLLVVLAAAMMLVVHRLPQWHVPARRAATVGSGRGTWLLAGSLLAAIMIFWAAQNDVYAYIERVGHASGLGATFIGFSLGVANLTGFVGASLVAALGTRVGRLLPLTGATAILLACIVPLTRPLTPLIFILSMGLTALAWNIVNPFQLGILASVDSTGRALALAATVTGAGLAIGPAVGATAIGIGGYDAVLWTSGLFEVISLLLVLPALHAMSRAQSPVPVS